MKDAVVNDDRAAKEYDSKVRIKCRIGKMRLVLATKPRQKANIEEDGMFMVNVE